MTHDTQVHRIDPRFDILPERSIETSAKWGKYPEDSGIIPAWLADMDFVLDQGLQQAITEYIASQPVGYCDPPPALIKTGIRYLQQTYEWSLKADDFVWMTGVVPALYAAVSAFTQPGDSVLVPQPAYGPFRSAVRHAPKRTLVEVPVTRFGHRLVLTADSIEAAITADTKLLMLCNPHNPSGAVYTLQELASINEVCLKHQVHIVSDEIHGELVLDDSIRHIPIATVTDAKGRSAVSATLIAPTKTYNLSGMSCSAAIVPEQKHRAAWQQAIAGLHPHPTNLAMLMTQLAWEGKANAWKTAAVAYLKSNEQLLHEFFTEFGIDHLRPQASFLMWFDCRQWIANHSLARQHGYTKPIELMEHFGVGVSDGSEFHEPGWARINFGTSRANLQEILDRMRLAFEQQL